MIRPPGRFLPDGANSSRFNGCEMLIYGLEGWCAASPEKYRGAFDDLNELRRNDALRQFSRQAKQRRCRHEEQAAMRNGLAIGAIEWTVIRRCFAASGRAGVDFDNGEPVQSCGNAMDVGLSQKGLQREGERDQQRHKISRQVGAGPDLQRSTHNYRR